MVDKAEWVDVAYSGASTADSMLAPLEISLTGGPACLSQQGTAAAIWHLGKSVKVSDMFDCGVTTLATAKGNRAVSSRTILEPSGHKTNMHTTASHPQPTRVVILLLMVSQVYSLVIVDCEFMQAFDQAIAQPMNHLQTVTGITITQEAAETLLL